MEKKKYVTPVAEEEAFVANSYVAKCTLSLTGNGMRCINPYHNHYDSGGYFTYVWIEVAGDACTTVVDENTTKSQHPGRTAYPGESVLFKDGTTRTADNQVTVRGNIYYVPSGLTSTTQILPADCYGLYYNDGSVTQNVLS